MTAARQPVTESTDFTGRIEAVNRVDIRARVTGFLQERTFQEGQEVKAGDVLFRIERPPFEAQLEQARANVASAQATLENARVALARARELQSTGAGTRVALDNAQAQERTANAALLGAQAAVRVADINLGYTEILSPDRRQDRPRLAHPGQRGLPHPDRAAGDHRQPGPDAGRLHRLLPRGGRAAQPLRKPRRRQTRCVVRVRLSDGRLYPPGRADRVHRYPGRPQHRQPADPRADPQPAPGGRAGRQPPATGS